MSITVPCKYLETRFKSPENKYFIGVFSCKKKFIPVEYLSDSDKRNRISFSVKGYDIPQVKNYDISLTGKFKLENQYGLTFYCESAEVLEPSDIEGIQRFLIDFIDGVGPKTAEYITDKFGEDTLSVIENEPDRLYEVPRLRKATISKIVESYKNRKDNAELVKLFAPFNISSNVIVKIKQHLEKDKRSKITAVEKIRDNPYLLSDIKGIGFETLNSLGYRFGCDPLQQERIESCLLYELEKAQNGDNTKKGKNFTSGHLYLEQHELLKRAVETLNADYPPNTVSCSAVAKTMCDMAKKMTLLGDNGNAYLPDNYSYETISANRIVDFLTTKVKKVNVENIIPKVEKSINLTLQKRQREAVEMAVNNAFSMIIGSAGTGKTTVLKAILLTLQKLGYKNQDIALAAPTGRAAQRMKEVTGVQAYTIHSLLGIRGDEDEPTESLSCKFLIIDEASMIDMFICYKIFTSVVPSTTRVLLLGDTGQLPSVGAGNVFHELCKCSCIPTTELNVVFRQANENVIIKNSNNIRYGREMIDFNDDFRFFKEDNQENASNLITELFIGDVKKYGIDNVICLSPLREKGFCSAQELNFAIQKKINPESYQKNQCKVKGITFRENDRIIQCQNIVCETVDEKNVNISNGDIGTILSIKKEDNNFTFRIDFGFDRIVKFNKDDMSSVKLAYALTVHKSQGAEFKSVIMPLYPYFGSVMLYRNLLYTAVTRAKEKYTIVGEPNCIYYCIRNNLITKRNTALSSRITKKIYF